jgi:hypothetical protein
VGTVRQVMSIKEDLEYDYQSNEPLQDQAKRHNAHFLCAVNEAMARLPEPMVIFNQTLDQAIIEFSLDTEESRGGSIDLPIGCQVVSHVTRMGITAGDSGFIIGYDQSPIGPLAIVMFVVPNDGYTIPSSFRYLAMQLGEYDATGLDLDRIMAEKKNALMAQRFDDYDPHNPPF